MPAVVRKINQKYEYKLEEIKTENINDMLDFYAVKAVTDPNDPQKAAVIDNSKRNC